MTKTSNGISDNIKPTQSKKKDLFGLSVDDIDCDVLTSEISNAIKTKHQLVINYVNANSIRLIKRDISFKRALKGSDFIHSDGIGIWLSSRLFKGEELKYRFNFTDCAEIVLRDCQLAGWTVFLLGSTNEMLERTLARLKINFPRLRIVGTLNGYDVMKSMTVVDEINKKNPDILWVGMGTPFQELWISENRNRLDPRIIQSVGDLITYLAGRKARGTKFIQKIGFEWFVRFLRHPIKYFNRYIIGIPIFFFLVMKEYFSKKVID